MKNNKWTIDIVEKKWKRGAPQLKRPIYRNIISQKNKRTEIESNNWERVKRHPITNIVLAVGVSIGVLYVSSSLFDAAVKAVTSFGNLRQTIGKKK